MSQNLGTVRLPGRPEGIFFQVPAEYLGKTAVIRVSAVNAVLSQDEGSVIVLDGASVRCALSADEVFARMIEAIAKVEGSQSKPGPVLAATLRFLDGDEGGVS